MDWDSRLPDPEDYRASPWGGRLMWPALVAIAWLIFELTRQPAISAAIACTKFGWDDWLTGCWLWRVDPEPGRGWTCFWFYVAFGLWKVMIAATGVMCVLVCIEAIDPRPRPLRPELVATAVEAGLGFALSSLTTVIAVALARRHRVKVWVDSRVHHARRQGAWPPLCGPSNRGGHLLVTALVWPVIVVAVAIPFGAIAGAVGVMDWMGRHGAHGASVIIVVLLIPVGISLAALGSARALDRLRNWISSEVLASSPGQCWTE